MSHGGARPNAGRKAGASTKLNEAARKEALATGISPLDYMLSILRDAGQPPLVRFEAAKAAAPYVHAKLASVEHKGELELTTQTKEQRDAAVAAATRADG